MHRNEARKPRESNVIILDEALYAANIGREQRVRPARSSENRKHHRYPIHWRVVLIHKNGNENEIYHGRTHDLSLGGASIFVDHNIFMDSIVVMMLAIPPQISGQKETIIVTRCRMAHTVFDSGHGQFRIGMRFLGFKGGDKEILSHILSKLTIPESNSRPYS